MAKQRRQYSGADILAGPGHIARPERVAAALAGFVRETIGSLEATANCPELALDLPQGLAPDTRLMRFVDAVAAMAVPVLDALTDQFARLCRAQRLDPHKERQILDARAAELIDYFSQLARVHGIAFAGAEEPLAAGVADRILESLARDLRTRLESRIAALGPV
ncbi:MAG: hypothetical protein ACE5ED_11635 [Rhodothalassiaceae bacterium]